MRQSENRRLLRIDDESPHRRNTEPQASAKGRAFSWPSQWLRVLASSLKKPHFTLNVLSIIFFFSGSFLFLRASQQRSNKLIVPKYVPESPAITKKTDQFETNDPSNWDREDVAHLDEMVFSNRNATGAVAPEEAPQPQRRIEFVIPGNYAPFSEALHQNFPYSIAESVEYDNIKQRDETRKQEMKGYKEEAVKLFIGVASECCTERSQHNRAEIRETWMKYSVEHHPEVGVKFFISQPAPDQSNEAIRLLSDEVNRYDDLVLLRGTEASAADHALNKTLGMLKYALASTQRYTHFLKTNDNCYVRVHKLIADLNGGKMQKVYKGGAPNPVESISNSTKEETEVRSYLADWGYVLSRDVLFYIMNKVCTWDANSTAAPKWYTEITQENEMIGALVHDFVTKTEVDLNFKAPWDACTNETVVKNLDLDAPSLFKGLHAQEESQLWSKKTVECSSGDYKAGDYGGWKEWRNSISFN
eukprot:g8878.t1